MESKTGTHQRPGREFLTVRLHIVRLTRSPESPPAPLLDRLLLKIPAAPRQWDWAGKTAYTRKALLVNPQFSAQGSRQLSKISMHFNNPEI